MQELWPFLATAVTSVAASSGFWAYLQSKDKHRSSTTRLLMGLSYDKITNLGMKYIKRGWISKDEYEDFQKYFYGPYTDLGGNGMADRIMAEVSKLPLLKRNISKEIARAKENQGDVDEQDWNPS